LPWIRRVEKEDAMRIRILSVKKISKSSFEEIVFKDVLPARGLETRMRPKICIVSTYQYVDRLEKVSVPQALGRDFKYRL